MYTLLLVDDEEEVIEAIVKKVKWEELGFQVTGHANNGFKAMDMLEEMQPDVVMTGIRMPYMDGLELCAHIKAKYPATKILLFTGFDDFEYAASNGMVKSYWNANYTLIHKANDVLEEMKSNPSLTGGDLVNKGEALLMRAFCYFNLVRAFGEVPLIDFKVGSVADANIPKSSVDQILSLIHI